MKRKIITAHEAYMASQWVLALVALGIWLVIFGASAALEALP